MTTLTQFQQSELKRFDEKYLWSKGELVSVKPVVGKRIKSFLKTAIDKAYALGKEEGYEEGGKQIFRDHQMNKGPRKTTIYHNEYKGITFDKSRNQWMAQISLRSLGGPRTKYLGRFMTSKEAARAYDIAILKYYGKGYINFKAKNLLKNK